MSADVYGLGWQVESLAIIIKGGHLRTIPSTFGPDLLSSFRGEDFKTFFFSLGFYVKTMSTDSAVLLLGRVIGYNSKRVSTKDNSIKVWSQLTKQFQRRFLNIFPIGS